MTNVSRPRFVRQNHLRVAARPIVSRSAARWSLVFAAALLMLAVSRAHAQLPSAELVSVSLPGGKVGTTFDVTLNGTDLDDARALLFSNSGITAIQKTSADGQPDKQPHPLPRQFSVTISASVPTGMYEVRAVTRYGVTNPRAFIVGNMNEVDGRQAGATATAAKEVPLESSISGQTTGERADFFRFAAKKGQRVLIESSGASPRLENGSGHCSLGRLRP